MSTTQDGREQAPQTPTQDETNHEMRMNVTMVIMVRMMAPTNCEREIHWWLTGG